LRYAITGSDNRGVNQVSVAFVKEESAEAASETVLPARPISNRPNLVTEEGLRMLEAELNAAQRALEEAALVEDINERRRQSAIPIRDTRYFTERVRTAHVLPRPQSDDAVAFGHTVTYERDDGRKQTFRIVGEDEANPSQGTISHGSPVAIALMGKSVGDLVSVSGREIEVLSIS
jgi:transcription elongation GreA/GreB family factor